MILLNLYGLVIIMVIIATFKYSNEKFGNNLKTQLMDKAVTKHQSYSIGKSFVLKNDSNLSTNVQNTNLNTTQGTNHGANTNQIITNIPDNLPNYLINGYSTKWSDLLKIKNNCHGNGCSNDWSSFPINNKSYFDNRNYCSFNEPYWKEPISSVSFNVCNQIKLNNYQINHNNANNYIDYYNDNDQLKIGSFIEDYQPILN